MPAGFSFGGTMPGNSKRRQRKLERSEIHRLRTAIRKNNGRKRRERKLGRKKR